MTTRVSSSSPDPILPSTAQELKARAQKWMTQLEAEELITDLLAACEALDKEAGNEALVICDLIARAEAAEARVQELEQERDKLEDQRDDALAELTDVRNYWKAAEADLARLQDYAQHTDECAKRSVVVECTCRLLSPPKAQS